MKKLRGMKVVDETLSKEIYDEVRKTREKLEELILPTEKVSEEELREIRKLKEESLRGEHIDWDELKREFDV